MNLKTKTTAEPRFSRVIQGPSNLSRLDIELDETNSEQFVSDWGAFSQTLLWIVQNGRDPNCVNAALEALKASELLDLAFSSEK